MTNISLPKELNTPVPVKSGRVGWRSPSNIALIKYWGKYGNQLPRNPSLSMTLDLAHTDTFINYEVQPYESNELSLEFYLDGKIHGAFRQRIYQSIQQNIELFPFIKRLHLSIESNNSFPHSSGIASSASSMSALALCICSIEQQIFSGGIFPNEDFYKKTSHFSRLLSGSACRSIFPEMAVWGQTPHLKNSSDIHGIRFSGFHSVFKGMHDDILIVSAKEKKVSSRKGHKLMDSNIYADSRYKHARYQFEEILHTLQKGDFWRFGEIVEEEALHLHALMMCSKPAYILMKPESLTVIEQIRRCREQQSLPVFFSLDAGPNVHILYPHERHEEVKDFIDNELIHYSPAKKIIRDAMGEGPTLILNEIKSP